MPESFPEGVDPSHYALPVFLEEPKDTYAARGAPAVLTCRIGKYQYTKYTLKD